MAKKVIHTDDAPKAVATYSQAIVADGFLYSAGQIGIDPSTGQIVEGGIEAQTRQVMTNLKTVLAVAGASFDDVVKANIFITTMDDFGAMNEVYAEWVGPKPPARSTVAVYQLPLGALVEIDVIAQLPS